MPLNMGRLLVAFLTLHTVLVVKCWQEFEVESLGQLDDVHALFDYGLKPRRVNRTTYAVSGTFVLKKDLRNYTFEGKVFHSSQGNRQYVQSPLKVPPKPFCDVFNNEYRKFVMDNVHPVSTFPYSTDDSLDLCTLFQTDTYYMENHIFERSTIPKYLSNGRYRIEFTWSESESDVPLDGFWIVARLY